MTKPVVLVRGGGDLASGVVFRLAHAGLKVIVTEIAQPLAVRRLVSFAEAIYKGEISIEDVIGQQCKSAEEALHCLDGGIVPVLVDPNAEICKKISPRVVVDGRMTKREPGNAMDSAPLTIGLGPGFVAGRHCHAVVETMRGPFLGRVYWDGQAEADTGLPETVGNYQAERVLRAPARGVFKARVAIGDIISRGDVLAEVDGKPVPAHFDGAVRGLLHDGLVVQQGVKVGDLDPRQDPRLCRMVSDKALAVGGGVLEAILARPEIRAGLW